jgi:hypothetical protein
MPNQMSAVVNDAPVENRHAFPAFAAVGAGLILGAAVVARRRHRTKADEDADGRTTALATYLREHLSGSDAAIRVVERLRRAHAGTAEGRLFGALFIDFQHERDVVHDLLGEIGASTLSAKRIVTGAGGIMMAPAASSSDRGDLAFLRTLEGLAIGVQGKRLLWRAMQELEPPFAQVSRGRLCELETLAVRQWEAIDERRRVWARSTFAVTPADQG